MHNGNNRRQGPPPGKGMNAGEKPKDFKNSILSSLIVSLFIINFFIFLLFCSFILIYNNLG